MDLHCELSERSGNIQARRLKLRYGQSFISTYDFACHLVGRLRRATPLVYSTYVDGLATMAETQTHHTYSNITIAGNARVHLGDAVGTTISYVDSTLS